MIIIPQGSYLIGTDKKDGFEADKEGPKTMVTLSDYWIDEITVTNQEFSSFIKDTGYITEAEHFGWSFVFHYFLSESTKKNSQLVPSMPWWYAVEKADWRHPEGIDSSIVSRMEHPVVQVSRNDSMAYAKWAGKRLPTEAEWEVAARGGTSYDRYPWGEEFLVGGKHQCNIWQGNFPEINTCEDGFTNTAPAKYYNPNNYGVYQMIGNVWEWCINPARIDLNEFQHKDGNDFLREHYKVNDDIYATRGGSFLCHESYCKRYRIVARNGNSGMSAANNLGFRCVKS